MPILERHGRRSFRAREEAARRALANTGSETLKLAKARYEGGVDSHLRYLDAQRTNFRLL